MITTNQDDDEVADLLEENDDSGGRVVIVGAGPDEADDVHHWFEVLLKVLKVGLLDLLEVCTQRPQMQVNVLRLSQRCAKRQTRAQSSSLNRNN